RPGLAGLVPLGGDAIDPPGRLIAEGMAADARVVPVGHEHRAIGRRAGVDGPEPRVVAAEEDLVLGAERGPLAGEREEIDLAGAGVALEHGAPIRGGQQLTLVDHDAARAAVAGADDLGDVAGHLLAPVPRGARRAVAVMAAVHRPDDATTAVAVVV